MVLLTPQITHDINRGEGGLGSGGLESRGGFEVAAEIVRLESSSNPKGAVNVTTEPSGYN